MRINFRSKIAFSLSLAAVLLAQAPAFGQGADSSYSFTLKQAIDYAVTHQSAVVNAGIDEQIARQKVNEIRGIGLPQVNGSADINNFLSLPTQLIPGEFFGGAPGSFIPVQFGTKYNANAGLQVSQLVFDGSYIVGLQATKAYLDLAKKVTTRTKIETVDQVTKTYYSILINKENAALLDSNILTLRKLYDQTKALNEAGFAEKLDVDRLEVAVTNIEVMRAQVQAGLSVLYQVLKLQMGMPVTAQLTLTDRLPQTFENPDAPVSDPASRIEYSMLESQRKLLQLDLKRHKYGYFPSLAAFGSLSYAAQRNEFDFFKSDGKWFETSLIGAKLTVPIFDGLQKHARIQQAKLSLQKVDNDITNVRNAITFSVNSASIQYNNAYKTLEMQRKNLQLAREVIRVTQVKYNEGVGSNIEVLNAETSLREAQANYFRSLSDLINARIDLQKAQGTLY
jgi:outer membrane protein TolC